MIENGTCSNDKCYFICVNDSLTDRPNVELLRELVEYRSIAVFIFVDH